MFWRTLGAGHLLQVESCVPGDVTWGLGYDSIPWQWATEWLADYYTPGGVDKDAWQYATDFPASYHGKSGFTDYVRRRRWARKAKLFTSGPWKRLGSTKLIDITMLQALPEASSKSPQKEGQSDDLTLKTHAW